MSNGEETDETTGKVTEWLRNEGYPLEYHVAQAFYDSGFFVQQGEYIKGRAGESREIDVLAFMDSAQDERMLVRACTVVECKWTKRKPWIAFTTPTTRMANSAIIAQSIGSELAEAALYVNAGEPRLEEL
jgi:hypothetical protein